MTRLRKLVKILLYFSCFRPNILTPRKTSSFDFIICVLFLIVLTTIDKLKNFMIIMLIKGRIQDFLIGGSNLQRGFDDLLFIFPKKLKSFCLKECKPPPPPPWIRKCMIRIWYSWPPSHNRPPSETPFEWRFAGGPRLYAGWVLYRRAKETLRRKCLIYHSEGSKISDSSIFANK